MGRIVTSPPIDAVIQLSSLIISGSNSSLLISATATSKSLHRSVPSVSVLASLLLLSPQLSQWPLLQSSVRLLANPPVMPTSFLPNTASYSTGSSGSWTMSGRYMDRKLLAGMDLTRSVYRQPGTVIHSSLCSRRHWGRLRRSGTVAHPPVYVHCIAAHHLRPCHLHINAHTRRAYQHWVCYSSL